MCGLFGFIGKSKVNFNKLLFCELGIDNDSRGGDSCGIFIDGKSEYGVDTKKKFKNFYLESELIKSSNKVKIAIGHDRKTSVGVTSLENAQPVIITNEDDDVDFVLIHNGTISNYEELRDKYLTNAEEYTDSQVMAYIIYFWGYDVLSEYVGTGAFLTVDYRQNKKRNPIVHFFKGKSKKYSSYLNAEEERPLYLIKDSNGYWFSSLKNHLEIYENSQNDIVESIDIECNKLYMIEDYKLYEICEYDRTNIAQTQIKTITSAKKSDKADNNETKQLVINPSYPYDDDYFGYDDYYQMYMNAFDKNDEKENNNKTEVSDELPFIDPEVIIPVEFKDKCTLELIQGINKYYSNTYSQSNSKYIYFDGQCYMDGDIPAEGIFLLSPSGYKIQKNVDLSIRNYYAFANGELLYHPKILLVLEILSDYFQCYPIDILETLQGKSNYYKAMPYCNADNNLYVSSANKAIKSYNFIMPFQSYSSYIISSIHNGIMKTYDIKKSYDEAYAKEFVEKSFVKYRKNYKFYDKLDLETLMNVLYERFNS